MQDGERGYREVSAIRHIDRCTRRPLGYRATWGLPEELRHRMPSCCGLVGPSRVCSGRATSLTGGLLRAASGRTRLRLALRSDDLEDVAVGVAGEGAGERRR